MKKILTALCLSAVATSVLADDAAIISRLKKLGLSEVELKSSPINGLKTAVTAEGIFYVSNDGNYMIQGKLYETSDNGVIDISGKILLDKLNGYKDEMIVYAAKNEKHVVTVFMDITCHYCHKLHEQIKEYNELGITMRYLAFQRGGMNSKTAQQMEAIFTAKDSAFAMNEAAKGNLPQELKIPNVVKKHYELGNQFGVSGTPSMITASGEVIGGYLPPKELLEALEETP